MSLTLSRSTPQINVDSKLLPFGGNILVGDYEVDLNDFLAMVEYVLTNTDLRPDDPRLVFVEKVKKMGVVPGWQRGGSRLGVADAQASTRGG